MDLISQLNTLESSGLIRLLRAQPELEYLFRHALSQDAAYNSLLKQDRKGLHLAVAQSLESLYPDQTGEMAATLAWHFEHTELREKTVHYLRQAGDRARSVYANQEALGFYQRALAHLEQLRQLGASQAEQWREAEISVRENIADLAELAGNHETALAGYDIVRTLLVPNQKLIRARLYRKSANVQVAQRDLEAATQLFGEAEAIWGEVEAERSAEEWNEWMLSQMDHSWLLYNLRRTDELMARVEKVRPIIERHGSPFHRARFFGAITSARCQNERFKPSDETMTIAKETFKAWQESGSSVETGLVVFGVGFIYLWRGEYDEAERILLYGLGMAEKSGDMVTQVFYLTYLAVLYRKLGKVGKAKEFAARSLALAKKTQMKVYVGMAMANLSWTAWREGHPTDTQGQAHEAMKLWSGPLGQYPFQWAALWPLLAIALEEQRIDDAADCARKMLSPEQQLFPDELAAAMEQALEAFDLGQTGQARTQFEQASRIAARMGYI